MTTHTTPDAFHRLDRIIARHAMGTGPGGITTGFCCECDWVWPCPTHHIANGWGDGEDCYDAHWCEHVGMKI